MGRIEVALLLLAACAREAPAKQTVVEVGAIRTSFGGVDASAVLDDAKLAEVAAYPGVVGVQPRMLLAVDASASGSFDGRDITFPVGGNVDGVDAAVFADDPELAKRFTDGAVVPVVISTSLVEMYNERIAPVRGLPVIDDMGAYIVERKHPRFTLHLGGTDVPVEVIGVSPHALPVGFSMPLETVRRWNREHAGEAAASRYLSLIVTLADARKLDAFAKWLAERQLRVK